MRHQKSASVTLYEYRAVNRCQPFGTAELIGKHQRPTNVKGTIPSRDQVEWLSRRGVAKTIELMRAAQQQKR